MTEPLENPDGPNLRPVELPIDGVLDLHTFRPQQVKELVPDYLEACRERGILRVRVIHGKGIGNLRRTVHSILARHPGIESFALASGGFGGWGATIVHLRAPGKVEPGPQV
jgi:DNA-nicking Smr family endonuclease